MTREKGILWLYREVLKVLPALIPELISVWFQTRNRNQRVPFLKFHASLDRSLLDIRQEFDLLPLIK